MHYIFSAGIKVHKMNEINSILHMNHSVSEMKTSSGQDEVMSCAPAGLGTQAGLFVLR